MTSFGIEWDTQTLLYMNLKKGIILPDKTVLYTEIDKSSQTKIILSAEDWSLTPKNKEEACLKTIEVILGVFRSTDPENFNYTDFRKSCQRFYKLWKNIEETLKIPEPLDDNLLSLLSDKKIDVLTYTPFYRAKKDGIEYFRDCARKNHGHWEDKDDRKFTYIKNIQLVGNPQITVGFELKRFFNMVKKIVEDGEKLDSIISKDKQKYGLYIFYSIRDNFKDFEIMNLSVSDNCKSFMLLIHFLIKNLLLYSQENNDKSYPKGYMFFKLRTNLYLIYDRNLNREDKTKFSNWLKEYNIQITLPYKTIYGNKFNIAEKILENLLQPQVGYVLKKPPPPNSTIQDLGIYTIEKYDGIFTKYFDEINYFPVFWANDYYTNSDKSKVGGKAPKIQIKEGSFVYDTSNNNSGLLSFDYGEWRNLYDDDIIIELRGFKILNNIAANENMSINEFITDLKVDYKGLCSRVLYIMEYLSTSIKL